MAGRCKACDKKLTEYEMTRKYLGTQEYVELCAFCYNGDDVEDRPELISCEDLEEEWDDLLDTSHVPHVEAETI